MIYRDVPFDHEAVWHLDSEIVRGVAQTQRIESFWSMFKRAHKGTFHRISPKHLHRCVSEFAMRHNMCGQNTRVMISDTIARMAEKRLMNKDLVAV